MDFLPETHKEVMTQPKMPPAELEARKSDCSRPDLEAVITGPHSDATVAELGRHPFAEATQNDGIGHSRA